MYRNNSKFGNVKTTIGGVTFDSKLESRYYLHLEEELKKGNIAHYKIQPRYELVPSYKIGSRSVRKLEYVADFMVLHHNSDVEVIDVKGVETDVFKIKRKMFEYKYGKEIKCLTFSRLDGGWITLEDLKKARKERKNAKNFVQG